MQPASNQPESRGTDSRTCALRELARARHRQLEQALRGRVSASAVHAARAKAIRRELGAWRESDRPEAVCA